VTAPASLVDSNKDRVAKAHAHMDRALEEPTLDEALKVYGGRKDAFWRALKRRDMEDEVRARYNCPKGVRRTDNEMPLADLIEDAEFLAETGETAENAARRLGFNSWDALYSRLTNNDRADITDRLARNTTGRGNVPQATYRNHLTNRRAEWSR
jgi:hypothetical protein